MSEAANNFPYVTLAQVEDVQDLLEGLDEVPVLNGITVDGLEALIPRLVLMIEAAKELEEQASRAGFPLTDDVQKVYGSTARVFIQGPGGAQVRLDVSKRVHIVDVAEEDQNEEEDLLTIIDPDGQTVQRQAAGEEGSMPQAQDAEVRDLFGKGGPKPEVTD